MRIGLYHGPLYKGAQGYETYGPYARYVQEFARHFDEVVVFATVTTRDTDYRGCVLDVRNMRVIELPDFSTHVQAARHLGRIRSAFRQGVELVDVINCRNTAPFGYMLYSMGEKRGVGFFYHFTSDPMDIVKSSGKYRGAYGLFARAALSFDLAIQRRVMRKTFSFVNGRLPYERLRTVTDRVELVISSTLSEDDFHQRESYTAHDPLRLLYVGYLKHMKGLEFLLHGLAKAKDLGACAELHLVGSGPMEAELRSCVEELGIVDCVQLHGYVPMGEDLNRHYNDADVFAFPSLSEGSPRVVLEALAHSLPVISTNVGSVPDLVADGQSGLIVPVCDADAMAAAIVRFARDEGLRRTCGEAGYRIARNHTVANFIRPMVEKAKALSRKQG